MCKPFPRQNELGSQDRPTQVQQQTRTYEERVRETQEWALRLEERERRVEERHARLVEAEIRLIAEQRQLLQEQRQYWGDRNRRLLMFTRRAPQEEGLDDMIQVPGESIGIESPREESSEMTSQTPPPLENETGQNGFRLFSILFW